MLLRHQWPVPLYNISPHGDVQGGGGKLLNMNRVFRVSVHLSETFLILRTIRLDTIANGDRDSTLVKVLCY